MGEFIEQHMDGTDICNQDFLRLTMIIEGETERETLLSVVNFHDFVLSKPTTHNIYGDTFHKMHKKFFFIRCIFTLSILKGALPDTTSLLFLHEPK